eukprot:COSAG02_NODE_998_length_15331_cov_38.406119_16_plen_54_part_00
MHDLLDLVPRTYRWRDKGESSLPRRYLPRTLDDQAKELSFKVVLPAAPKTASS